MTRLSPFGSRIHRVRMRPRHRDIRLSAHSARVCHRIDHAEGADPAGTHYAMPTTVGSAREAPATFRCAHANPEVPRVKARELLADQQAGIGRRLNSASKRMAHLSSATRSCASFRVSSHCELSQFRTGKDPLGKYEVVCSSSLGSMISMDKSDETKLVSDSRCGLMKRAAGHHLAIEARKTAKLALPMALTQVGQIAMMTTDLVIIGRLSPEALAAVALASRVYLVSFTFGMGLLAAIAPLAAQAFGADNLGSVRRSLRMGLWTALLLSFPTTVFALRGEQILLAFGQTPDAARLAQQYLFGLSWGVAPALSFQAIRTFMCALNRPKPILWITLVVIPINALLVYLLIHGKFGLPRLELFGAGLATTLVNCGTFLAALWFTTMRPPFRDYRVLAYLWRFDWLLMRQLVAIGMPVSIGYFVESGLVSAASFLAGLISTGALAAHQIVLQVATIVFMISSGMSTAAAVRVGHAVGGNDRPGIKRAGLAAMLLAIGIVAPLTLAVIVARFEIAKFFLDESTGDASATIELTAHLLLAAASSFITAAMYNIAAGGLRGLKDTRVPLLFAGIAYSPIGFSLSYVLSLKVGLGVIGIWIGLSIGTAVYALLLVRRFQLLANRFPLQSRCSIA